MTTLNKFLKTIPEEQQERVRQVIVWCGGWSNYKPRKTNPDHFKSADYFHLWAGLIKKRKLIYYWHQEHGTTDGFDPKKMSWVVNDQLKTDVLNAVNKLVMEFKS